MGGSQSKSRTKQHEEEDVFVQQAKVLQAAFEYCKVHEENGQRLSSTELEIENLSGKASDLKQQVAIDERNLHTLQAIHHLVQFEEKLVELEELKPFVATTESANQHEQDSEIVTAY